MGMRLEKLEVRMYDESMAEILGDHILEKALYRKHWEGKKYRHRKPEKRNAHGERYSMHVGKYECGNSHVRNINAEKYIRADFLLEQADAEIAEALELAEKQSYFRNLNEWLRWA